MERTTLFIDLDDTIISNEHTKAVLLACLQEVGFNQDAIKAAYPQARGEDGFFAPAAYLRALNATPEQAARWELSWKSHLQGIRNGFLYGAEEFLCEINREKYIPTLLTLGNPSYQEDKVKALGISEYFEALHFCTEEKQLFLAKLIPADTHFTIIDDREDCRTNVAKGFPNATTYEGFSAFVAAEARS
jgi:FMN phosphatase YigB (HAD superfamily)